MDERRYGDETIDPLAYQVNKRRAMNDLRTPDTVRVSTSTFTHICYAEEFADPEVLQIVAALDN